MQALWKNWLRVWCAVVLLVGVLFAMAVSPATDGPARWFFVAVSSSHEDTHLAGPAMRGTVAVLGAVMIGWALTLAGMVRVADTVGAPAWRSLTGAMLVWYVVDSAVSIASGFALNAVSNTVFVGLFLVPIVASGVVRPRGRPANA